MIKSELLNEIASKAGGEILATDLVETVGLVKRYITNVFTVGEDEDGGPIAQKRNINWYVYDEGSAQEAAYYGEQNWKNPESKNITGSTLNAITAIYRNRELRGRTTGVICKGIRTNGGAVATAWAENSGGVLDLFMVWVASNSTIQANGGAASDSDLEFVVLTEAWGNVETALT